MVSTCQGNLKIASHTGTDSVSGSFGLTDLFDLGTESSYVTLKEQYNLSRRVERWHCRSKSESSV